MALGQAFVRERGFMMEAALGIFGSIVPLLILGGIVFGVVKLMTKHNKATGEGAGVAIRRFFQYGVMLAMLVLTSLGVAGLIDAVASAGNRITVDATGTALSIAFVFVGLPVFVGLAMYTAHRFKVDPREQHSVGWAIYLTIVLFGSLVAVMSLTGAFLAELLDNGDVDRTIGIYAIVWAAVWVVHWWSAQNRGDPQRLQAQTLLGSGAGLFAVFFGIAAGATAVLTQIYDRLFQTSIVDTGIEPLAGPFIILVVGIPVWWWYWFRQGRHLNHGALWLTYVLLLGVLSGAIAVVIGASFMIFGLLEWFLGDPGTTSPVSHFDFVPVAIGFMAAGSASWLYHSRLLGNRGDRKRTEVDRVYGYLLSGAGLVVAASGVATLITVSLKALADLRLTSFQSGDATAAALTLLVIGIPLWWRYWSAIQRYRRTDPDAELASVTRRIYIFLLFGVAGIVAVVNLIIIVFMVFNDILEGGFGSTTLDDASVAISLLITAGMIAGYHFTVFQEDREVMSDIVEPTLIRATVVGSTTDPIVDAIRSDIGATVTVISAVPGPATATSVEDALKVLKATDDSAVVVIADGAGGYRIMPVEK
jgi:hypothetical protein